MAHPSARSITTNTCSYGHTLDLFAPPVPEAGAPEANASGALTPTHPLAVPVFRLHMTRERDHLTDQVRTPADVARLASELCEGLDREAFFVVALSTASRVVGAHCAHVGTVDASVASPREVFKFALLCNARSVVVFHNHPSGNVEPSRADVAVSRQIKAAGDHLGVPLVDSVVVGFEGQYTSLVERGLL